MVTLQAVSKVLYDTWDPLDIKYVVTATDEYDDWAVPIRDILNSGASATEIADALDETLTDIGLIADHTRSTDAAAELIRLRDGA